MIGDWGGSMQKILVTGSTGFLGSRIVDCYSESYDICKPTHKEMDITSEESVFRVFEEYKPDIVIHCAAVSDVGLCDREPEKSYKINVEGSINIAKASERIHAKCILCSSDQVYFGSVLEEPHKEEEMLFPFNVYGREKLKAEQECLAVNSDCVLLRLSWMYDVRTMAEKEHGDFFRNLLSQIEGKGELSYPVYDKRGITDVNEVVTNLKKTFQIEGGIYNFGSPNDKNTFEVVHELFESMQWDTDRLCMNKESFKTKPRNLCMCQEKIENCGISFSTTANGLLRNLEKVKDYAIFKFF